MSTCVSSRPRAGLDASRRRGIPALASPLAALLTLALFPGRAGPSGRRCCGAAGIIRAKLQLRLVVVPAPLAFLWLPLLLHRPRGGLLLRLLRLLLRLQLLHRRGLHLGLADGALATSAAADERRHARPHRQRLDRLGCQGDDLRLRHLLGIERLPDHRALGLRPVPPR